MIYLQDTDNPQEVKFIARSLETGSATVTFTDEQQNTTITDTVTLQTDRYYTCFSQAIPELKDDRFYMMVVTYSGSEIYRSKVFVTNQTVASYSINDGKYEERETTNAYKLLDD